MSSLLQPSNEFTADGANGMTPRLMIAARPVGGAVELQFVSMEDTPASERLEVSGRDPLTGCPSTSRLSAISCLTRSSVDAILSLPLQRFVRDFPLARLTIGAFQSKLTMPKPFIRLALAGRPLGPGAVLRVEAAGRFRPATRSSRKCPASAISPTRRADSAPRSSGAWGLLPCSSRGPSL